MEETTKETIEQQESEVKKLHDKMEYLQTKIYLSGNEYSFGSADISELYKEYIETKKQLAKAVNRLDGMVQMI